jgi:hypothetical protein
MSEVDELRAAITRVGGLASQADLGRRWALTRQRVNQMISEPGFPEPITYVSGQRVWVARQADAWRTLRDVHIARARLGIAQGQDAR